MLCRRSLLHGATNVTLRFEIVFLEVLSEMPRNETVPLFEQELSSADHEELRFAVLGLFRFDALRYEAQILNAIQAHPTFI